MSIGVGHARTATTGGCGCGGACGGGCGGGSCGCGVHAAVTAGTSGFVRPRFFADQLLTDEDLEQLTAYVLGKNRLHNRFLHGAGVACGLQVSCHPCGGSTVTVHPGYALDCCGDDVVVECAVSLDLRPLIRDLRARSAGGVDCGDPCGPAGGPVTERLYLYVHHAEEQAEPVAPYATDEPCGAQACEPTRIREGYRFELRHSRPKAPVTVLDRLLSCFGDEKELLAAVAAQRLLGAFGLDLRAARAAKPATDLAPPAEELETVRAFVAAGRAPTGEDEVRDLLDTVTATAAGLARAKSVDPADRDAATDEFVADASDLLAKAAGALRDAGAAGVLPTRTRPFAEATLRGALEIAGAPNDEALEQTETVALATHGVLADHELLAEAGRRLGTLRDWLLRQAERSRPRTDCGLLAEIRALPVPAAREFGAETIDAYAAGTGKFAELLERYVRECLCWALNPPCAQCDDTGVLLAAIDVRECEVLGICLAVRTTLLTGPNLAYWLPPLAWLGREVEEFCCPGREHEPAKLEPSGPGGGVPVRSIFRHDRGPQGPAMSERDAALLMLNDELAGLGVPAGRVLTLAAAAPRAVGERLLSTAASMPDVRATVAALARQGTADAVAAGTDAARAHADQAAAESTATARGELRNYKAQITRTLGQQVQNLQKQLESVTRELGELRAQVAAGGSAPSGGPTPPAPPGGSAPSGGGGSGP